MDPNTLYGKKYKSSWKALPIDGSEYEWAREMGVSKPFIPRTLQDLEENAENNEKSLYFQIKQPKSKQFIEENGADTHPVRLYWEIKQLISAIVHAKKSPIEKVDTGKSNKDTLSKLRGATKQDVFANKIFSRLAFDLSTENLSAGRFTQIQLMGNSKVREHMVQIFQSEITVRIEAVKWLTSHKLNIAENTGDYMETAIIENILAACKAIDVLIDRLLDIPYTYTDKPIVSSVTSEDISALYEDLVAERKRITTYGPSGEDIITAPSLPNTPENKEIIRQLDDALALASQSSKNRPLTQEGRSQIETVFENYLLATIPAEKKARVENFANSYSSIKNFLQYEHDFEEYKISVQQILVNYVKDIFKDAANGYLYSFAYDPYTPKSSSDLFLGESIKNVQQNISYKIYTALLYLCRINILRYYGTSYDTARVDSMISEIRKEMQELAKLYPTLPLGDYPENFPVDKFVAHYNQVVAPVLGCQPLNTVGEDFIRAYFPSDKLLIGHILLHICESIAVYEIEQSLIEIQKNYETLTSFYNRMKAQL